MHRNFISRRSRTRPLMRGFTMIELLVTIAIAAILVALGASSMRNVITGRAVAAETDDFVAGLQFARSEALKRGSTVTMCKSDGAATPACATTAGTWQNWMIYAGSTAGVHGTEPVLRKQSSNSSNALWGSPSPVDLHYIEFKSTGLAIGDAVNAGTTTNGSSTMNFTVNPNMAGPGTSAYRRAKRQVCLNVQGRVSVIDGNATCP